jgi:hypothetical protein
MTCVFQCFQSHCHISKELHEILRMMVAITIFGKSSFIFSFLGLVLGPGCTFEETAKKQTKCQKSFYNQIRMNHLT